MTRMVRTIGALCVASVLAAVGSATAAARCGAHPWCDASLSPAERTALVLEAMTLDEKISLMAGDDFLGVVIREPATGTSLGVARLGIPTVYHSDGPVGPREGNATAHPAPPALAATFSRDLAERTGAAIANEVKLKGNDLVHAPTVDIVRTPLAGRTFETYGEDPFLAARIGVSWIRGAQSEGIIANVKHYVGNSQEGLIGVPPLTGLIGSRFIVDHRIDERTLREIYLPPFEAAIVEGEAGTIMCAYNLVNGAPACSSSFLLERVLRGDWGFDGFVVTDYFLAQKDTIHTANNGTELEMPYGFWFMPLALRTAVLLGQVTEATIDERVGNILRTMFAFGVFDRDAYPTDDGLIDKAAHAALAQEVEEEGLVLLSNDGILPLDAGSLGSIAVIGESARRYVGGGGSSVVTPFATVTPLRGIRNRVGELVQVRYRDGSDVDDAVKVARNADVAIVFAADKASEGGDKTCLSLSCPLELPSAIPPQPNQDVLIAKVLAANPRSIVVLQTGGPVLTPWRERAAAVIEAWYPGQQGGAAIARVLFGDADPGGRLPMTFPKREGDLPTAGNLLRYPGNGLQVFYSEGPLIGYRWYDAQGIEPAFPFGHGLSYTTFGYDGLEIHEDRIEAIVSNVGERAGSEVAQLYVAIPPPGPGLAQPPRQLKGFAKVALAPGESARIVFPLDERTFAHWNANADAWATTPACYGVSVGSSSRDLRLEGAIAKGGGSCD